MNQTYDVVVCGTGLVECILSGLLSKEGKRILHIDRNPFYGGQGASLNLTNLWKVFRGEQKPPADLGMNRDWNIDLIPKFIICAGNLVRTLLKTGVTKYLEWKCIDGTYVLQMREAGFFSKGGSKICKVPGNDSEALKSDLMGLLQKNRCRKFYDFIQSFDYKDKKTWGKYDVNKMPAADLFKDFGLEDNTIDFLGHAVALYTNDQFLKKPAIQLIQKIQLYTDSIGRYGDSPFVYPVYGLGGIAEGFSRMCAVNGGTFMLNKDIDEILFQGGKVVGVRSGDQVAKCSTVICDPSYALKCKLQKCVVETERILRCICILDHPIPNTKDIPSVQIIIPQRQVKRKNDIYVMMVSSVHCVSKKPFSIAIISTVVETADPVAEIECAFELVGPVKEKFVKVSSRFVASPKDKPEGLFISDNFDSTSHFQNQTENVLKLYKQITGKELDLVNLPEEPTE